MTYMMQAPVGMGYSPVMVPAGQQQQQWRPRAGAAAPGAAAAAPRDPHDKRPPCSECAGLVATIKCVNCDDVFCDMCFQDLHARGRRTRHRNHRLFAPTQAKAYVVTKLQALARAQRVRKHFPQLLHAHRKRREQLAAAVLDDLLHDFIAQDFVPGLLVDVFSSKSHEYDMHSPEHLAAEDVLATMCNEVVPGMAEEAVRSVMDTLIAAYVKEQAARDPHPLELAAEDCVDACVREFISEMVSEAVSDMSTKVIAGRRAQTMLANFIDELVEDVVASTMKEGAKEAACQSALDDIVGDLVAEGASECMAAARHEAGELEHQLIEAWVQRRLVQRAALRCALTAVVTNAESSRRAALAQQLLTSAMLRHATTRHKQLAQQSECLRRSRVLKALHVRCVMEGTGTQLLQVVADASAGRDVAVATAEATTRAHEAKWLIRSCFR